MISAITSFGSAKSWHMYPPLGSIFSNELSLYFTILSMLCNVMQANITRQHFSGVLSLKPFKQGNLFLRSPMEHSTTCRVLFSLRKYFLSPSSGKSDGVFGVSSQLKFWYPLSPKMIAFWNGRQPIQWNQQEVQLIFISCNES